MKAIKTFLLTSLMVFLSIGLSAQTVSGKLVDEKNQPLSYANVVLLSLPDSAFVSGTISGEDGFFTMEATSENQIVKISSIGYKTVYKPTSPANIGIVQLVSDAQMLGEVVVKGDLPKMQLKGDAMVTTVQGSILEKAGTGEDLLNKIPGVSAGDDEVNVFGSGTPEIYINGRKVRDNSELDRLSSDQIKRVEVVKNPGARYDASVKAVIRIVTKKAVGDGFGFNNRFVTRHRRTYGWTTFDQYNFNYRKNGFDLSGTLFGGRFRYGNNQMMGMTTYLDKLWYQNIDATYGKNAHSNVQGIISLNYQFNEKHSMGVRYDIDRNFNSVTDWRLKTDVYSDGELYENNVSTMLGGDPSTRHSLNYYYNGQIGDWNIDFNADGLWNTKEESMNTREITNGDTETEVNIFNKNDGTLYASKLVLSYPLWQGSLSFGGEYSHTDRTNVYTNKEGILDNDDSRIKEGSTAAFIDYSRSFGKIDVQAGVRYENVNFNYYEQGQRMDEQSRDFNNVFPSVNINFPIGKTQFQLSYSSGITRPSYDLLRSNIYYSNKYTYQTGNPFLKPVINQNLILSASYKWINFQFTYNRVKDDIIQICEPYSEDNPTISLLNIINAEPYDNITAAVTLSPTIGWWSPQLTAQVYKQWFTMDGHYGKITLNKPRAFVIWRNSFTLPAGFLFDVSASYYTKGHSQNQYMTNTPFDLSMGLYKSFFKERLSLQLQVYNLLETNDFDCTVYSGIKTATDYISNFRQISLTMRYKFNATKSKYKGTGAGASQKSRM
ncbi:TonB-dependent receptor [Bacteroides caecigallinarum]|uniref:TonB-dependent receptor domain-containing protein n=1 Tax=Bacteroides caecigallinarum TaxID=1411144 RepID=UPI0019599EBD|nr:TonB-dependent receptor [Bacteroides caecigallinarum]MBM6961915.1 TonB-dependent receptor [Bacteroides caecigallinarum]